MHFEGQPSVCFYRHYFVQHQRILDRLYRKLEASGDDTELPVRMLLLAALDTAESLTILVDSDKPRDAYVLGRVFLEAAVNACFVCASGSETAERAFRHFRQKSYRRLNWEMATQSLKISLTSNYQVSPKDEERLKQEMEEFTSNSGRELNWTAESLKDRIEGIAKLVGHIPATYLLAVYAAIYDTASEIAHGTMFGALFRLGLTQPYHKISGADDIAASRKSDLAFLLWLMNLVAYTLVTAVGKRYAFEDLVSISASLHGEMTDFMSKSVASDLEKDTHSPPAE